MYVIYVDILFLINFIMDGCIFWISGTLMNKILPFKKIMIGSGIAAILYCFTLYLPTVGKIPNILVAILIPIVPILYLFKPKTTKEFLKTLIVCNGAAFIIGGASFNLYYYVKPYLGDKQYVDAMIPISCGIALSLAIGASFRYIRKRLIIPKFEYSLTIHEKDKKLQLRSIVDTGNCLYTLGNHKAVTVVTYDSVKEIIPKEYEALFHYSGSSKILKILEDQKVNLDKFYLIPFRSIGCEDGVLLGIEVESISYLKGKDICQFKNCVLGISSQKVFSDDTYTALLHPDFIQ
ncbi:MAG: sigma-E processing peptidase SpoIIGA [Cellulosilyticaceae bacterium]